MPETLQVLPVEIRYVQKVSLAGPTGNPRDICTCSAEENFHFGHINYVILYFYSCFSSSSRGFFKADGRARRRNRPVLYTRTRALPPKGYATERVKTKGFSAVYFNAGKSLIKWKVWFASQKLLGN